MNDDNLELFELPDLPPEQCPLCDGTGQVVDKHDTKEWFKPCPMCGGKA